MAAAVEGAGLGRRVRQLVQLAEGVVVPAGLPLVEQADPGAHTLRRRVGGVGYRHHFGQAACERVAEDRRRGLGGVALSPVVRVEVPADLRVARGLQGSSAPDAGMDLRSSVPASAGRLCPGIFGCAGFVCCAGFDGWAVPFSRTAQTAWTGWSMARHARMRSSASPRSAITRGGFPMKRCTSQREYRSSTKSASSGSQGRRISRSVSRFSTPFIVPVIAPEAMLFDVGLVGGRFRQPACVPTAWARGWVPEPDRSSTGEAPGMPQPDTAGRPSA
ncbi:hypothetical protein SAMN04489743_3693 [Pseudarthrobacter equi]|uniref:Uncharacterized protein n=1 Tax=Pseudarthrobacter equi TaxID=728066 RepID=A0A1H2BIK2_9MICC|nr:hypothetical protein SAMN04489743_3693 [Pseudarthrobacter equi]